MLVVHRVSFELLVVSFGNRSHRHFAGVPPDFDFAHLVNWIDFVRSSSFGELDSH